MERRGGGRVRNVGGRNRVREADSIRLLDTSIAKELMSSRNFRYSRAMTGQDEAATPRIGHQKVQLVSCYLHFINKSRRSNAIGGSFHGLSGIKSQS
jgi:hypothetical protein